MALPEAFQHDSPIVGRDEAQASAAQSNANLLRCTMTDEFTFGINQSSTQ
jgi:hypothetical protein